MPAPRKKRTSNSKNNTQSFPHDIAHELSYTKKQLDTKKAIDEILEKYYKLENEYYSDTTPEKKKALVAYMEKLKSKQALIEEIQNIYVKNPSSELNPLTKRQNIAKIIKREFDAGNLIEIRVKSDEKWIKQIRKSQTVPYKNISASGNVITIMLPTVELVNDLYARLKKLLANDPVIVITPCSNLIIVLETGNYTSKINDELGKKVRTEIMNYMLQEKGYGPPIEPRTNTTYIWQDIVF